MKEGIILLLLITTVHSFLSVPTAQKVPESDFYHHPKVRHEKAKEQKYGTQSRPLSFQNLVFEGLVKYLHDRQSFRTRRIKPIICTYSMAIPGEKRFSLIKNRIDIPKIFSRYLLEY